MTNVTLEEHCNENSSYNSTGCTGCLKMTNVTLEEHCNENSSYNSTGCTGCLKMTNVTLEEHCNENSSYNSTGCTGCLKMTNVTLEEHCNENSSYNSTGCTGCLKMTNVTLEEHCNENSSYNSTGCTGIRIWAAHFKPATTILMNLFVAVSLLNITFLINQQIASMNSNVSCIIIAAIMHFSMLATFTWYFFQGLHLYLRFITVNTSTRNYKLAVICSGWGFPALVVIINASLGIYKPLTIVQMCWITNKYVHYLVNIGYYAIIFIFTTLIFILIAQKITQARFMKADTKVTTRKLSSILSLFVLLGLTWGVAFFAYGDMVIPSYYIFTILNSFQVQGVTRDSKEA
ncbi:hypothetical protein P4O66_001692 [Electrophorus voltai]|uniref:G-protein coupled receptors family 2 profile 2 domain-containing protein n=1 Tax=Electrophorus voltai TaxID=2609070 RepID=A0AAD8Z5N0_9TELE|nr:hypothetical protein P4O66_001692 [Electrophorus voltai]